MEALLIQNFDQFLDALNNCEIGVFDYQEVFESARIEENELEEHIAWNSDSRHESHVMARGEFEVKVICWEPGQEGAIQEFTGNTEWVYVVTGELTQELFEMPDGDVQSYNKVPASSCLNASEVTSLHRLINNGSERCISVHMYA